ncbi:MAG: DUF433 domain-containing protein [Thermoanaerobaculia bacterium]
MATTRTAYEHVVVDGDGIAWIEGANTKVVELVAEVKAHGWSPEELAYQHPHLRLGQVHSALAYYWDHRTEIDAELQRREELVETLRRAAGEHPLVARLRATGQI